MTSATIQVTIQQPSIEVTFPGTQGVPGVDGVDGAGERGSIEGTLSDQEDLQAALDAKEPAKGTDDNYVTDAQKAIIAATTAAFTTALEAKLNGIEANADVTDAANVAGAGAFMKSTDDTDDINEGATKKFATEAEKGKLANISVTQAVYLDAIESRVNDLDAAIVLKGPWDASAGTFPGGGVAQAGWSYVVSVSGTVDGVEFSASPGDRIICLTDNASTTTYAGNWLKADYSDLVASLDGTTGTLTLGSIIANLASKTTPVDGDSFAGSNSESSNASVKFTWANIKAALKSYFDTLYQAVNSNLTTIAGLTATTDNFIVAVSDAWASRTPAQVKATLGLNNVDNTSDVNKPISTATQAALDAKEPAKGTDDNYVTDAEKEKIGYISVTQPVNLDTMESDIATLLSSAGIRARYAITGTYASASTFTFSGDAGDAEAIERSLFTCTNSAGSTRRIGYIKSASHSAGTVTATVVTDSDLASGDISFKVTLNRKIEDYEKLITIPGEQVADASNPQGMFYRSLLDAYLLPVNSFVRTAAAGSGAACAWNVYKGATNLFTSAQDMTTSTTFDEKRPNTNTISSGDIITLRVTSSAGATNKASDLQVQLFIVPQTLFTTAD